MRRRWISVLIFLIVLVPATRFAWVNRKMPSFGWVHDDAILFISAKSLTIGGGYRILSVPGAPPQTKYPVLYPLYLSLIWRLNPNFPDNLRLASLFCWILVVAALALSWRYYRGQGWNPARSWVMLALIAVNPWTLVIGQAMLSETLFLCFVLATFIVVEKPGVKMALLAGALAGCAYLTRSAGIVLLGTVPAILISKRERTRAAAFFAAMLPFIVAWMSWVHFRMPVSPDPQSMYYTNYFGEWRQTVGPDNIAIVVWKNLDDVLFTIGQLVIPNVVSFPGVKIITQTAAVAIICGVVRLARRGEGVQYALFCLASSGVLLIWTPSSEKLVMPMLPLLVAGAVEEAQHLFSIVRSALHHRDRSQRIAAYGMGAVAALLALNAFVVPFWLSMFYLPAEAKGGDKNRDGIRAASEWIAANVPASAHILTDADPLVYLYAGRRGSKFPSRYRWYYADDHEALRAAFRQLVPYCRTQGFDYVLASDKLDMSEVANAEDKAAILDDLARNPGLKSVFHTAGLTIYRVEPAQTVAGDGALVSAGPESRN